MLRFSLGLIVGLLVGVLALIGWRAHLEANYVFYTKAQEQQRQKLIGGIKEDLDRAQRSLSEAQATEQQKSKLALERATQQQKKLESTIFGLQLASLSESAREYVFSRSEVSEYTPRPTVIMDGRVLITNADSEEGAKEFQKNFENVIIRPWGVTIESADPDTGFTKWSKRGGFSVWM